MDKRYQVFISSTYEDLVEERKEVMQALLELDCIPAGMELFPASSEEQWTLIKRVIDDSDYYLLIIGGRYGSENSEGKSYTQMEYEYALSTGKPIISFLPKYPEKIPSGKCESSRIGKKKLEEFKKLASSRKLVKFWSDSANLGSLVSRSIIMLIKNFPSAGWVRAENVVDEYSAKEILKLQKENSELRQQLIHCSTQAPDGTEQLVQGDDSFQIKCTYYESGKSNSSHTIFLNFTWNQLFAQIAPELLAPCSEIVFKASFDSLIENEVLSSDRAINPEKICAYISEDSFNAIKIQFRALGLITLFQDTSAKKKTSEYWKLTPYGDHQMMKMLAIRKTGKR